MPQIKKMGVDNGSSLCYNVFNSSKDSILREVIIMMNFKTFVALDMFTLIYVGGYFTIKILSILG